MAQGETLWEIVRSGTTAENVGHLERVHRESLSLLGYFRDTFPTYTLHDATHVNNVLSIMEELLGDEVRRLTALEAALLILGATMHDLGMVYRPEEIDVLLDEPEFEEFLAQNPTDFVAMKLAGAPSAETVEAFCRSRHAEHILERLSDFDQADLRWNDVGIGRALGVLCASHNRPAEHLFDSEFRTDFLAECDLRFCAVILRLADLLDFDSARSPAMLYRHLGLKDRPTAAVATSDREWRKHLASRGFRFPDRRLPNYVLDFVAAPRSPDVEHDIQHYLEQAEKEMRSSRVVLDSCSEKWRRLPLPGSIDRSNIEREGYELGEFTFSLDREKLLDLFMGEQLYDNQLAFVRELLQNAIDACRLRRHLADAPLPDMAIRVEVWEDPEGHLWVSVDDDGFGMDAHRLRTYFLGVGQSYYQSDEIYADLLRSGKPLTSFRSIGRFGIGVLSCFVLGDRVEVSTRGLSAQGRRLAPLRLQLDGLHDFFLLQRKPTSALEMPSPTGTLPGYRRQPGTTIAVRIRSSSADASVDEIARTVRSYLSYPEIPIVVNGSPVSRPVADLGVPLLAAADRVELRRHISAPNEHDIIGGITTLPLAVPILLDRLPLDLTAHTRHPQVRGQLCFLSADVDTGPDLLAGWPSDEVELVHPELRGLLADAVERTRVSTAFSQSMYGLEFRVSRDARPDAVEELRAFVVGRGVGRDDLVATKDQQEFLRRFHQGLLEGLRLSSWQISSWSVVVHYEFAEVLGPEMAARVSRPDQPVQSLHKAVSLGHNGIVVPTAELIGSVIGGAGPGVYVGDVCLFDDQRPELSVSRDKVLGVPLSTHILVATAARRALRALLASGVDESLVARARDNPVLTLGDRDIWSMGEFQDAVVDVADEWVEEALFEIPGRGPVDRDELGRLAPVVPQIYPARPYLGRASNPQYDFAADMAALVLQRDFDVVFDADAWLNEGALRREPPLEVRGRRDTAAPSGLAHFPLLLFVDYLDEPETFTVVDGPLNSAHPLGAWVLQHATALTELPGLFSHFRRATQGGRYSDFSTPDLRAFDGFVERARRSRIPSEALDTLRPARAAGRRLLIEWR